jgi:hypothetical protein
MEKHAGKIPVNANITIDYAGEKPKVDFEYPNKEVVRQQKNGFFYLVSFFIVILIIVILRFWLITYPTIPSSCSNFTQYNSTSNYSNKTFSYSLSFICDNGENYTIYSSGSDSWK